MEPLINELSGLETKNSNCSTTKVTKWLDKKCILSEKWTNFNDVSFFVRITVTIFKVLPFNFKVLSSLVQFVNK